MPSHFPQSAVVNFFITCLRRHLLMKVNIIFSWLNANVQPILSYDKNVLVADRLALNLVELPFVLA